MQMTFLLNLEWRKCSAKVQYCKTLQYLQRPSEIRHYFTLYDDRGHAASSAAVAIVTAHETERFDNPSTTICE